MTPDLERFLRNSHIYARLVEQILEQGYLRQASGDALTFDQLNILKFLARPGPSLVKDVARFIDASYPAASKAVTRLEKKKLVTCVRYGPDRRAELVEVTPKGRKLIQRYERLKQTRLKSALRGKELGDISRGLERAIALLMRERSVAGNPCLGCGAYYAKSCVVRAHGQACRCE